MNNVSDSFNALAYANANTVGGMENYYTFLRKYDAQFKELGLNVDQASVLIAAATHKFGGGRAALSGLSDALKESNGDLRALEEALDMAPGSLENASQLTGQYAGQLDKLADEEAEHKSLLDQLGAAWEDLSLSLSPVLEPLASAIGLIGQIGSFGIQIGGLKTLRQTIISVATSLGILTAAEETNTVAEEANTVATEGNTIAKTLGSAIESIAAVATTAYAAIVGVLTGEIGLVTAATMIWNAVLAANPVMLVVLALAALVAIIYEVGKAFGWWKDVNSMLQAIWAGIQRLWSAFINHPDVQAIIQALTNAWNWLVGAIGNAWNAVMKFLGISTGGKFDVVRAIIDGIGAAWNFLKAPIQFVIGLVQKFVGAIQWLWNGFNNLLNSLGPFGDLLLIIMGPIGWIIEGFRMLSDVLSGNGAKWGWLGGILQRVVGFFQWVASGIQWVIGGLTNLWNAFTGSSIVQGILNGITAAFNWLYNGIMWVVNGVNSFISAITGGSMSGVGDVLSGIGAAWEMLQEPISQVVQFITDFATAIWNVLTGQQDLQSAMSDIWNSLRDNVGSAIWSILELLGNFVLNAFQYAWQAGQQFVYNLGMWFAQLPGKVWNYLVQVKNHIVNVATQWVNQGKQKAQQFLMGVLNFLIQLPIRVKNYLLQVLSNIISAGAQWVSNAKSKASELVSGAVSTISSLPNKIASALNGLVEAIVKPFREAYNKAKEYWDQITSMGGARGGDLPSAMGGDLPGVSSYTSSSNEVSLEHNLNINLNIDAPGHINTEQLGEILSDRGFIRELVNNRDFQLLDSEAKERLNLKMNRARGV